MSSAAMNAAMSGLFAIARKGGLTGDQMREIEGHRAKARPVPFRVLADMYGVCESDIADLFSVKPVEPVSPPTTDLTRSQKALSYDAGRRFERMSCVSPFWTEEKDAELRRMYFQSSLTSREIAHELKTTINAVYSRAARLGIRRPYAIFGKAA
jgi:hypothetical protein